MYGQSEFLQKILLQAGLRKKNLNSSLNFEKWFNLFIKRILQNKFALYIF